jgi:pyruvate/2-oxoglutarate dehydrogenase complex dihydrolipoamide acyltransferase (E2) component
MSVLIILCTTLTKTAQARDNKLTIEDMAGGTFTISNVC